jgi:hypothetical protein
MVSHYFRNLLPEISRLFVSLMVLALASCSHMVTKDSSYDGLLAVAETNPDSKAIVGLWNRQNTDNHALLGLKLQQSQTLLFRADGTGLIRNKFKSDSAFFDEIDSTTADEKPHEFKWIYRGDGTWGNAEGTIIMKNSSSTQTWRISNGCLLSETVWNYNNGELTGHNSWVYRRAQ